MDPGFRQDDDSLGFHPHRGKHLATALRLRPHVRLEDAARCALVSLDSTMRSNISVGLPIDLLVYETDSLVVGVQRRIDETDPYFQMVHTQWGEGLRRVFAELPNPDWK